MSEYMSRYMWAFDDMGTPVDVEKKPLKASRLVGYLFEICVNLGKSEEIKMIYQEG